MATFFVHPVVPPGGAASSHVSHVGLSKVSGLSVRQLSAVAILSLCSALTPGFFGVLVRISASRESKRLYVVRSPSREAITTGVNDALFFTP